jgi:hypothetical protein
MRERTLASMVCLLGVIGGGTACRTVAKAPRGEPGEDGNVEVVVQRCFRFQTKNDVKHLGSGHVTGPFEFRGVCVRSAGQKEDVGTLEKTGTFDSQWKSRTELESCSLTSVTTVTYESGSYTGEGVSSCKLGPDGQLVFESNGVLVKGTGAYEGIQGTTSAQVKVVSAGPPEMDYDLVELRYTLPRR